mmetsp:Transcript_10972/g.42734  ORF Transcript_10972/g.42734 Transcript_10972/m.42734 type:complete len:448 (+) Transcript_10972:2344-3687(+)
MGGARGRGGGRRVRKLHAQGEGAQRAARQQGPNAATRGGDAPRGAGGRRGQHRGDVEIGEASRSPSSKDRRRRGRRRGEARRHRGQARARGVSRRPRRGGCRAGLRRGARQGQERLGARVPPGLGRDQGGDEDARVVARGAVRLASGDSPALAGAPGRAAAGVQPGARGQDQGDPRHQHRRVVRHHRRRPRRRRQRLGQGDELQPRIGDEHHGHGVHVQGVRDAAHRPRRPRRPGSMLQALLQGDVRGDARATDAGDSTNRAGGDVPADVLDDQLWGPGVPGGGHGSTRRGDGDAGDGAVEDAGRHRGGGRIDSREGQAPGGGGGKRRPRRFRRLLLCIVGGTLLGRQGGAHPAGQPALATSARSRHRSHAHHGGRHAVPRSRADRRGLHVLQGSLHRPHRDARRGAARAAVVQRTIRPPRGPEGVRGVARRARRGGFRQRLPVGAR